MVIHGFPQHLPALPAPPQELPGGSFSRGRAVHRRFAARPGKEERQQQRQVPTTGDTWGWLNNKKLVKLWKIGKNISSNW